MRRSLWALVRGEAAVLARTPWALLTAVALPFAVWLLVMLFIGSSFPGMEFGAMPGVRVVDRMVAELAVTVAVFAGIVVVTLHVARARACGMARWLRRTPMRDGSYFAAQVIVAGGLVVVSVAVFAAVMSAIYGAPAGWRPLSFAGTLVVVCYCAFSVGLLLGGLRMPQSAARVAAPMIFVVLFVTSGMGVPREGWRQVAPWLYEITTVNPLAQLADFVFDAAYLGKPSATWPAVVALTVAALVVNAGTRRAFDWSGRLEPST
ncbi:ABC transporter permease [Nonomuraea turcica]|uniref:ABC transporter permease n=1 Tax=Nonomuraea sp. G32 TaxID=3067274 RepID=UPI00273C28CC|nr:ABC transporter permease [Nonomuraea sp. G32]MDP4502348.1 ABC transporter permease [Nonomuraea sp. G32]